MLGVWMAPVTAQLMMTLAIDVSPSQTIAGTVPQTGPKDQRRSARQCGHPWIGKLFRQQVDLDHSAAPAAHEISADHVLGGMIRTLDQNIGPQRRDQCFGGV